MKVKTIKEVHIRSAEPYIKNYNKKGVLFPGFEIEVVEVEGEEIIEGEGVNQIRSNKWYKDKNGDYYWSGGFEKLNGRESDSQVNDKFNYSDNIVFNRDYLLTKGAGVTIAVLDTGIYKSHSCFNGVDINLKSVYSNDADDKDGHGTACISIIASRDITTGKLTGIAPESKLISYKVAKNGNSVSYRDVKKALQELVSFNVDIINMSFSIAPDDEKQITSEFNKFSKNVIFIASARNNEKLYKSPISFPASYHDVISVGQISQSVYDEYLKKGIPFNKEVNLIMKYIPYAVAGIDDPSDIEYPTGSSFSTALISGLAANIISYFKKNDIPYDRERLLYELFENSSKLESGQLINEFILYKI